MQFNVPLFKAAQVNILVLTLNEMTTYNVKMITCSDEPQGINNNSAARRNSSAFSLEALNSRQTK